MVLLPQSWLLLLFCLLMFVNNWEEKVLTQKTALVTFAVCVCVCVQLLLAFLAGTGHVVPDVS